MKKLYRFQRKGIRQMQAFLRIRKGTLLADDMGLGKTIQALWLLKLRPYLRPALIICPASAKWHWQEEAQLSLNMRSVVLNSRTPFKRKMLDYPSITIINYEILPDWEEFLSQQNFRALIYDEAHYVKNLLAIRTQCLYRIAESARHIIAISGTPLLNRPAELYPTLHLIDPKAFPSYPQFAWRYCARHRNYRGWDDRGKSHIPELHRILISHVMVRRTKKQVLHQLPPKTQTVIPIDIESPNEYKEAENDIVRWLAKWSKTRAIKASKSKRMVRLGYLQRLAAKLKMRALMRWIDDWLEEENGKLVVFGIHHFLLHPLRDRYRKQCVLVDGSVTGLHRHQCVQKFQRDPGTRLFLGNLYAAGTVITLTAASAAAMAELDWVPGSHKQAEDRICRIGQKKSTIIYYLVARNTIEHDLCRVLQRKADVIRDVLDGGGGGKETKLDVFDMLEQSLKTRRKR